MAIYVRELTDEERAKTGLLLSRRLAYFTAGVYKCSLRTKCTDKDSFSETDLPRIMIPLKKLGLHQPEPA